MNPRLFEDFIKFSQLQIGTWDIDPTYPLLKDLYTNWDYDKETALWHTIVYTAFYHLGSAETFLETNPQPNNDLVWNMILPTGVERRGFRGRPDLIQEHLHDICRKYRPFTNWIDNIVHENATSPEVGWEYIREDYSKVAYGGSWSSYKFADLLKWVHGYEITAPDFGVGGGSKSAGPISGLAFITEESMETCLNEEFHKDFYGVAQEAMSSCSEFSPRRFNGMDQCETCLCDFNSMIKGSYYVGHDIDLQLEFLRKYDLRHYLAARKRVFPVHTLGEEYGWHGVRKELKWEYKRNGKIYNPFTDFQSSWNKRQRKNPPSKVSATKLQD